MADRPVTMYVRQEGEDRLLDMQVETSIGPKPFQVFKRFGEGTPPPTPGAVSVDSLLSANPFYVAHRCGGANWPEFSEPGILGSLAQGYQALEVSVYRCSTGEFVCSHDWTTTRMTGVSHEIWQTPWSTLAGLTSTAQYTTNPSQPRTPLLRLSDVMALAPNAVIFIDHKATSGGSGNTEDFASMNALLDYMDTFPNSTQRFVWKVFRDAWQTAVTARDRGYRSWGIYYADEVATPNYVEHFDILGQEHNAPASSWSPLLATGKRVMGHIITTPTQRDNAVAKGATGIMNSAPLAIPVSPTPGPDPDPDPTPSGWSLLYETDFSTNDGWVARQETQSNDNSYNHPDNVSFGSRGLVITGRREERGGRPFTTGDVTGQHITVPNYFRADVRATLPTDYGMWPAPLWFRPLNSPHGEIDVCETWTYDWPPARYSVAMHRDYSQTPRHASAFLNYSFAPNPDPAAPHTYTVIKTHRRMEFLIDGVRAYCWEDNTPWNGTQRIGSVPEWYDTDFEVPTKTWYPRVTLQLGGPETPDPLPEWQESEMVIHWLHIYQQEG